MKAERKRVTLLQGNLNILKYILILKNAKDAENSMEKTESHELQFPARPTVQPI